MRDMNERPVCHRAEDLVTYLYGEANEVDSRDFADHLQQCDACRVEFGVFQQVHDSILVWRNEALGSAFSPAALTKTAVDSSRFVQPKRKLSAIEALREFFSVSPLWLRGAMAFAALLLCVLGVLAISRSWNKPVQLANNDKEPKYSQQQFDQAVQKQVDDRLAQLNTRQNPPKVVEISTPDKFRNNRTQVAIRVLPKTQRPRGLSRQEREQLAADLRLIPSRDDDELPFVFSDEPNQ
jgi:anti-sigma factor RsiW